MSIRLVTCTECGEEVEQEEENMQGSGMCWDDYVCQSCYFDRDEQGDDDGCGD